MRYYILDGKTIKTTSSITEWATFFEQTTLRIVGRTHIDDILVSTVFLGLDHNFLRGGPPVLFETMLLGEGGDGSMERYCTWDEAEAGHAAWVRTIEQAKEQAIIASSDSLADIIVKIRNEVAE